MVPYNRSDYSIALEDFLVTRSKPHANAELYAELNKKVSVAWSWYGPRRRERSTSSASTSSFPSMMHISIGHAEHNLQRLCSQLRRFCSSLQKLPIAVTAQRGAMRSRANCAVYMHNANLSEYDSSNMQVRTDADANAVSWHGPSP